MMLAMVKLPTFAGVKGRRARCQARRGIRLRDAGITRQTQSRYYSAVSQPCKAVHTVSSMEDMDEQIADWIELQAQRGATLNLVANSLSGLHYFLPSARRKPPASWKLFATWRKMEVPSRAPPLPEDLTWAMMGFAMQEGNIVLASLLGLAFHCFLRTGEMLAVRPIDLLLKDGHGIVHLPLSKGEPVTRYGNQ